MKLERASRALLKHGRPRAAIRCIYMEYHDRHVLHTSSAIQALVSAASSTEKIRVEQYETLGLIKALQTDPAVTKDELLRLEWIYLGMLDGDEDAKPQTLEAELSNNPKFFTNFVESTGV